jgi:hypothetical protein
VGPDFFPSSLQIVTRGHYLEDKDKNKRYGVTTEPGIVTQ